MMGDLHILTFQAWLSAPSPLFAHASCIPSPPNAYGQGWPAQRELPGAGGAAHPCPAEVLSAPINSVGKHGSPGLRLC